MVATGRVPRLTRVDGHLKLLAEVSLAVGRAEAAAGEGGFTGAREALDEAEEGLQVLRERWPEMVPAERTLVGRAAAPRSSSASTPWRGGCRGQARSARSRPSTIPSRSRTRPPRSNPVRHTTFAGVTALRVWVRRPSAASAI